MLPSSRPRARLCSRTSMPPLATVVVVSMALFSSLWIPIAANARTPHCHRKHRRHHHGHHRHIALPPVIDVDGDPPAEPPGFPPDVEDAPTTRDRDDGKPCPPPRPPSKEPGGEPRSAPATSKPPAFHPDVEDAPPPRDRDGKPCPPTRHPSKAPAKPPAFSVSKPPSPAPAVGHAPSPSHSVKSRSHPTASPPNLLHAKAPSLSPSKPPSPAPASAPSRARKAPEAPSFSPSSEPPLHAKPPRCTSAKPTPPKPPMTSPPAQSPLLSPARPPAAPHPAPPQPPHLSQAKPQPPASSPVKPPHAAPANSPMPSPSHPPRRHTPANRPAVPPVAANPPPALPPAPEAKNGSVFDVRAFGASGNESSSCGETTRAFRAAWRAACSSDSSTLLVPSDGVFTITSTLFAGPCKPGLTFQIDGVLMPPDGPASWPASDSRRQWIVFYKADGMTLAGRGTIEGNGEEWWDLPCKPHRGPNGTTLPGPCDSPALIRFVICNDVTVRDLRIENSPQFHLKFDACTRVRVDGLAVSSPAFSPNTDGVHVENTTDVQILNSRIYNGDDCVSIGSGCSGIHIENVTCGHGHGISIGSLGVRNTRACVSNVTVRNARILDSDNGVRIKTWQGGTGAVSGVEFADVRMENVRNCIVIDQYYCLGSGCANRSSAVRVAGVAYRDIRGTYNPRAGGAPIRLACSDAVACTGITMSGVELLPAAAGEGGRAEPFCWNAYGLMETQTLPPVSCLQEGRPLSLQDQQQLTSC